jgi:hypothetical protein
MSGCLEASTGRNEYLLRNVRLEPRQPQPQSDTTGNEGPVVTEGASVRLADDQNRLGNYLGQRVTVTATIQDDGRNRIGTAGASGVQTPSGDQSQAATGEHYSRKEAKEAGRIARNATADGTTPELRVQAVKADGAKCDTASAPHTR